MTFKVIIEEDNSAVDIAQNLAVKRSFDQTARITAIHYISGNYEACFAFPKDHKGIKEASIAKLLRNMVMNPRGLLSLPIPGDKENPWAILKPFLIKEQTL